MQVRTEIQKVHDLSQCENRGAIWYINNHILVMTPDTYHLFLEGIIVIHHQKTPAPFLELGSELKENLSPQQETDMHAKEHL